MYHVARIDELAGASCLAPAGGQSTSGTQRPKRVPRCHHIDHQLPLSLPPFPQILVVMGLLVRVINWAPALAGLAATLALIPIAGAVGRTLAGVRRCGGWWTVMKAGVVSMQRHAWPRWCQEHR